jgi:hypothetical protein
MWADSVTHIHVRMSTRNSVHNSEHVREKFIQAYSDLLRARAYTKLGVYFWMGVTLSVVTLYPDPNDRTKERLLGGLMNVSKVEFLESLSQDDPRREELKTIVYPDAERRAVLEQNLHAMDKFLFAATREVFDAVARLNLDEHAIFGETEMHFYELEPIVRSIQAVENDITKEVTEAELLVFNKLLKYLNGRLTQVLWEGVDHDSVWGKI